MMQRLAARAVASTLIFTLTYSPILGTLTDTVAAAQTVQDSTTTYSYDTLGNLTDITDPLNRVTTMGYDALNRVKQEQPPPAAAGAPRPLVQYSYDGLDQVSTVTDPRNLVTSYTNDGLGNQGALTSPDTGTGGKTYDAAGNLLTSTDALKKVTTYTYDVLNRVKSITYPTVVATVFEYDGGATPTPNAIGHLTKMTDASGSTQYGYDQHGRLITQTQSISRADGADVRVTGYAYGTTGTSTGKLVSLIYPSGNRVAYDYDTAGRVQSLTLHAPDGASKVLLSGIGYAPLGPVQSWAWGNDSSAVPNRYARTFDLDGRVVSYPLGNPAKNGLVRTVHYDAASRITGYTHTAAAGASPAASAFDQTFGYDDRDRLTSVVTATGSQGYAYDLNGNRTQVTYGANAYAYTISPTSNILNATAGPLPARSFLYDANGSLTSDRPTAYTYRDNGRLTSMSKSATESAAYAYNGLGQRVNKRSTVAVGGANVYVYDQVGHLLGEYVAKGAALEETVYLGDQPVAVLVPQGAGTAVNYVYADQINTPRVITNATDNAMVWRWDNADPFGVGYPIESPVGATAFVYNLRFPGQLYDRESNTHYNIYRDYDPQTGRYLQSDPIGLDGGINSYQYVDGAPLDSSDPSGLLRVPSGVVTRALIRGGGTVMGGGGPENPVADIAAVLVGVGSLTYDMYQANKDDCDCGNLTRTQALALAQAWAEVPRASRTTGAGSSVGAGPGRTTIELGRLNKSSQGANYNQLKANGASGLGYENPLMPTNNYVFDHPDGHDDNDAAHHKCPHIHAYHPIKGGEIFRYKAGTK